MVLDELVEWWQDVSRRKIGSRTLFLQVPPRWGRTSLLEQLAAIIEEDEALSIVVLIPGASLPPGQGLQAQALRDCFTNAQVTKRQVAELLGVDRLGGAIQLGLGVAGLFVSQLGALVGLLLAGVGVGAAGRVWDNSPAGQEGVVARMARSVAAVSVSVPVVVIIDDADRLEPDLAVTLVENLIARPDGQVLVVAAADPGSDMMSVLTSRARYGLTAGRVHNVALDPGMGYQERVALVGDLRPGVPTIVARRIGQRVQTFAEVFAVASAERLAEVEAGGDAATLIGVADEVIDARVDRSPPSTEAVVLAWAGGVLHARQAERAVAVLGARPSDNDNDVLRFESLVRLADPASPRLAEQLRVLTTSARHGMAEAILDAAAELSGDPRAGLVERVVAWQAAHRIRADLVNRDQVVDVQIQLVHGLEDLGDLGAAYQVAEAALTDYLANHPEEQLTRERDDLAAAVLRLARARELRRDDPLIEATITSALARGAAVGLEARIWAAIDLLDQPGQRELALTLTDQIATELETRTDLGAVGNRWRLLLAFHTGRAGYPAITQRLLDPMLGASAPPGEWDAAQAVLRAVSGLQADTRLQVIGLEAELEALPLDADDDDDRLRIHHALAADYGILGNYAQALRHGEQELLMRSRIRGPDYPGTLATRYNIACWTGLGGDPAEALRLSQQLLPDQERVLGRDHPETLTTRSDIAVWTGQCGRLAEALRLSKKLLPDLERVLGPDHPRTLVTGGNIAGLMGECGNLGEALRLYEQLLPDRVRILGPDDLGTLTTRGNIADLTGECGDPVQALRLYERLPPDQERVLGPDHLYTLTTRYNIARWTGQGGHPADALRQLEQLLPDLQRALGPDHPRTLTTRHAIATWTGESGHLAAALPLYEQLLPDQERILGPDHPGTLATRSNIAYWTSRGGDPADALRLYEQLLPDLQRILGPDDPRTLTTRSNIAYWTSQGGDPADALRLYEQLLPDQERVLGADHPDTLTTRNNIARWTGQGGNPAEALHLYQQLLPDQERILGPDHPGTLATRSNIAALTGRCGGPAEALRLSQQLLPDQERVLGPDHPGTLTNRNNMAVWTGRCGRPAEALRLSKKLLPDRQRVLGPDHPDTLTTRGNIADLTGK